MMFESKYDNKKTSISDKIVPGLRLVAWEITRSCNLFCAHCRASSVNEPYQDELSTDECFRIVDEILEVGKPVLIISGGEPLMRPDVFQIAEYAARNGLKVAMGSNGTLINGEIALRLKEAGVSRIGVSLDFPVAELQDKFRGESGAYDAAMAGIVETRKAGIDVQINSTITRLNAHFLDDLLALALRVGAVAFHPFMLVPTGRGKGLEKEELDPAEYERILNWVYDKQVELGEMIFFKPTDAPHYMRLIIQRNKKTGSDKGAAVDKHGNMSSITRGCLAGSGFCFISHRGRVQGCGYLDVAAGDLREKSFGNVWRDSPLFEDLRDLSGIKGKCGVCEYKRVCGGCRARAYEATGDYLAQEPYCIYEPAVIKAGKGV
ncbi:radical SAM protein [Chloroflexota bacterium]